MFHLFKTFSSHRPIGAARALFKIWTTCAHLVIGVDLAKAASGLVTALLGGTRPQV